MLSRSQKEQKIVGGSRLLRRAPASVLLLFIEEKLRETLDRLKDFPKKSEYNEQIARLKQIKGEDQQTITSALVKLLTELQATVGFVENNVTEKLKAIIRIISDVWPLFYELKQKSLAIRSEVYRGQIEDVLVNSLFDTNRTAQNNIHHLEWLLVSASYFRGQQAKQFKHVISTMIVHLLSFNDYFKNTLCFHSEWTTGAFFAYQRGDLLVAKYYATQALKIFPEPLANVILYLVHQNDSIMNVDITSREYNPLSRYEEKLLALAEAKQVDGDSPIEKILNYLRMDKAFSSIQSSDIYTNRQNVTEYIARQQEQLLQYRYEVVLAKIEDTKDCKQYFLAKYYMLKLSGLDSESTLKEREKCLYETCQIREYPIAQVEYYEFLKERKYVPRDEYIDPLQLLHCNKESYQEYSAKIIKWRSCGLSETMILYKLYAKARRHWSVIVDYYSKSSTRRVLDHIDRSLINVINDVLAEIRQSFSIDKRNSSSAINYIYTRNIPGYLEAVFAEIVFNDDRGNEPLICYLAYQGAVAGSLLAYTYLEILAHETRSGDPYYHLIQETLARVGNPPEPSIDGEQQYVDFLKIYMGLTPKYDLAICESSVKTAADSEFPPAMLAYAVFISRNKLAEARIEDFHIPLKLAISLLKRACSEGHPTAYLTCATLVAGNMKHLQDSGESHEQVLTYLQAADTHGLLDVDIHLKEQERNITKDYRARFGNVADTPLKSVLRRSSYRLSSSPFKPYKVISHLNIIPQLSSIEECVVFGKIAMKMRFSEHGIDWYIAGIDVDELSIIEIDPKNRVECEFCIGHFLTATNIFTYSQHVMFEKSPLRLLKCKEKIYGIRVTHQQIAILGLIHFLHINDSVQLEMVLKQVHEALLHEDIWGHLRKRLEQKIRLLSDTSPDASASSGTTHTAEYTHQDDEDEDAADHDGDPKFVLI